jgi:hypothetical protein
MGFFQGVARAYGEISERKEQEKARKAEFDQREKEIERNRGWQVEDRDLAVAERRREALIAAGIYTTSTVGGSRKGSSSAAGDLTASFNAVKDLVSGSERSGEYLAQIAENPSLGPKLLAAVSKAQEGMESSLTADQIIDNFKLYSAEGNTEVLPSPENMDELIADDDAYYTALQKLKRKGVGEGIVLVSGDGLRKKPSTADYQFADEKLFGVVSQLAFESGDDSDISFANTLDLAQSKEMLLKKYGQQAFNELISRGGDAATLLPGSVYGSRFVVTEEEPQEIFEGAPPQQVIDLFNSPNSSQRAKDMAMEKWPNFDWSQVDVGNP